MENFELKVSVVMPVYNAEFYLQDSIESVLNQTLTDFEFIIIDDGSIDNSKAIIQEYDDSRIKLLENEHDFIESLNRGMKLSRAPYIARMDADDIMMKDRLDVQHEYMIRHPEVDVCGSSFIKFGFGKEEVCHLETRSKILKRQLLTENPLAHPTTMIRKKSVETLLNLNPQGPYRKEYIYAEDYKLWCELVERGGSLSNLPDVLLKYRSSDNQAVKKFKYEMTKVAKKVQFEYFTYIINTIGKKNPDIYLLCKMLVNLANKKQMSLDTLLEIVSTLCYEYA